MKRMKTIQIPAVPATTAEMVDCLVCDFCGAALPPSHQYRFERVTLEIDIGSSYPEGGMGEKTVFDCCANCWKDKVEPALCALGGMSRIEKWSW